MKLSQYAKQQGMSYRTALRWWKAGLVKGYQSPTGTIIVREEPPKEVLAVQPVAIYARVSSHEHRENLERQAERMISYGAAKGYQDAGRCVSKWYVCALREEHESRKRIEASSRRRVCQVRVIEMCRGPSGTLEKSHEVS
jgi:predicted site-specific integrase-resolvase